MLLAAVAFAWAFADTSAARQPQRRPLRTSETDERLKDALKRFPQADTDKDGILTATEAQAFAKQRRAAVQRMQEQRREREKNRPVPDFADVRYGPHERNVFDVWLPDGVAHDEPVPVFVYFHGGGFVAGDKSKFDPRPYLEMGYAAVSGNYRFVNGEDVLTPIPMEDCARALQYLRYKADDFGIDPTRVAVSGGSAGAVITMWIAYKDDMADPASDDPIERQSTGVSCIVPKAGPTNLDPAWIRANIGGSQAVHSSLPVFYGVRNGDYGTPEVKQLIRDASVINHVSADDPPSLIIYRGELDNVPLPEDASQGLVIHHPYFGKVLKDKLDKLGVECEFVYGRNSGSQTESEFLKKHLSR
jgi:acetyl esterase/lipase